MVLSGVISRGNYAFVVTYVRGLITPFFIPQTLKPKPYKSLKGTHLIAYNLLTTPVITVTQQKFCFDVRLLDTEKA